MSKMTAEKVLVCVAHPNLTASTANRQLMYAAEQVPQVILCDLYGGPFDLDTYKGHMKQSKALVLQFPFYWASAPSEMKRWIDEIFMGLAQTEFLQGKSLMVAVTAASEFDAYCSGGRNRFTMDELLRPYQLMANHSGMVWQTPHVVYGMGTPDAVQNLNEGMMMYRQRLEALAVG